MEKILRKHGRGRLIYTALGPIHANMQGGMASWAQQKTNKAKWVTYMCKLGLTTPNLIFIARNSHVNRSKPPTAACQPVSAEPDELSPLEIEELFSNAEKCMIAVSMTALVRTS